MTPLDPQTEIPSPQTLPPDADKRLREAARREDLRGWADFLCLWRFCDHTACRRARCCRGPSNICFPRYAPLLPDKVKTWFQMLGETQAQGLSFDAAMERIGNSAEGDALSDWYLAVATSLSIPPRERRDTAATHL